MPEFALDTGTTAASQASSTPVEPRIRKRDGEGAGNYNAETDVFPRATFVHSFIQLIILSPCLLSIHRVPRHCARDGENTGRKDTVPVPPHSRHSSGGGRQVNRTSPGANAMGGDHRRGHQVQVWGGDVGGMRRWGRMF